MAVFGWSVVWHRFLSRPGEDVASDKANLCLGRGVCVYVRTCVHCCVKMNSQHKVCKLFGMTAGFKFVVKGFYPGRRVPEASVAGEAAQDHGDSPGLGPSPESG